jgi:hypothetical protein
MKHHCRLASGSAPTLKLNFLLSFKNFRSKFSIGNLCGIGEFQLQEKRQPGNIIPDRRLHYPAGA